MAELSDPRGHAAVRGSTWPHRPGILRRVPPRWSGGRAGDEFTEPSRAACTQPRGIELSSSKRAAHLVHFGTAMLDSFEGDVEAPSLSHVAPPLSCAWSPSIFSSRVRLTNFRCNMLPAARFSSTTFSPGTTRALDVQVRSELDREDCQATDGYSAATPPDRAARAPRLTSSATISATLAATPSSASFAISPGSDFGPSMPFVMSVSM